MIHWSWLILALILGSSLGAMLMALVIGGTVNDD